MFRLNDSPRRASINAERFRLVIQSGVTGSDERLRNVVKFHRVFAWSAATRRHQEITEESRHDKKLPCEIRRCNCSGATLDKIHTKVTWELVIGGSGKELDRARATLVFPAPHYN